MCLWSGNQVHSSNSGRTPDKRALPWSRGGSCPAPFRDCGGLWPQGSSAGWGGWNPGFGSRPFGPFLFILPAAQQGVACQLTAVGGAEPDTWPEGSGLRGTPQAGCWTPKTGSSLWEAEGQDL